MAVYRHFQAGRTVFYIALAGVVLSALALAVPAQAADPRYTVEKVEVDVTAANAVQAREKALEQAQMKAYRMLAEKAYGPDAMKNFQDPDPLLVSAMVQDFEVTNEQLSKVRYKGVFTVRFRPNMVRQYLPQNDYVAAGTPDNTAAPAVPTLILPYFQAGQRTVLWDDSNTWLKAWAAKGPGGESAIVPIGDILDVSQMPDDKALTYDSKMLAQMKARYGAREAAILIGVLKEQEMEVSVYQALPTGPQYAQTIVIQRMASEEPAALQARAADRLREVMAGSWKHSPTAPPPAVDSAVVQPPGDMLAVPPHPAAAGPVQTFDGRVVFTTVQEWVRLKSLMERAPGVRGVMVRALKPREAQVVVNFAGDAVQLATSMQQAGVIMRTPVNQPMGYGAPGYEFSAGATRY